MADQFWRYAPDPRHQAAMVPASQASLKRSRPDFPDMQAAPEMLGYYSREDERTAPRIPRDTESINASYERYLRNGLSSYPPADPIRPVTGGLTGRPVEDARLIGMDSRRPVEDARLIGMDSRRAVEDARLIGMDSRNAPYASVRPEAPLPPDASNTLFIEGLPANCTRREVSHIFRPFVGFREVRLVNKASRHDGGDPLVLCFVDFATSSQAASALDALQGYKFDEHDRESANLRLQFARFPGPRSAGGPRGRR